MAFIDSCDNINLLMKKIKKNRVLFLLHVPPPVHGASMVGLYIKQSSYINSQMASRYVSIGLSNNIQDIGVFSLLKIFRFFCILWKELIYLIAFRPSVVYVTPSSTGMAFRLDSIFVLLAKLFGRKVLLHFHNKGVCTMQNRCFDNFLYHLFFHHTKVILLTPSLYSDVKRYVERENVYFCPNGIPEQKNICKRSHSQFNILFLSNMIEEKGVWVLLDACRKLRDYSISFHCDFVGNWADITECEFQAKVDSYELWDYVTAHGAQYGENKNLFFETADVLCFPSYYHNECFPLVLLEAMSYSLPCISSVEGGIPDIIEDSQTGFVVKSNSSEVYAEKLKYLEENPVICKEMGNKAHERYMKNYTLNVFEYKFSGILNSVIDNA